VKYTFVAIALLALFPAHAVSQESRNVRLVLQQNGQALVTEQRTLKLPKGEGNISLPDLPLTIDPQTLQVRSKTAPRDLAIHDLALDDELLTQANLLRRHLGMNVTLILPDGKTRDGRTRKEATILSTDESPVFLIDGAVYSGPYEAIIYPELPKGLSPRPRLTLNFNNNGPTRQNVELSYIARELSWSMDYVLSLNKTSTQGQLTGWVTLQNRSGADFNDAHMELLAGEPRSVRQDAPRAMLSGRSMTAFKSMDEASAPEELFEYHLYRLKRPTTLSNQQSRQVQLFESSSLGVERKLVGRANAFPSGQGAEPVKEQLDAVLSIRNVEALGLGVPLPKGTLRVFQNHGEGKHFLGEALVERTPAGGTVEARIGQVFDITVERVAVDFEKTGKSSYKCTWELRLKNSKKEPQRIVLQELLPGKWTVQKASQKWSKPSSGVLEFAVEVPADTGHEPHLVVYTYVTEL
jgi:hypothetical protein